jgi:hypothetical protein
MKTVARRTCAKTLVSAASRLISTLFLPRFALAAITTVSCLYARDNKPLPDPEQLLARARSSIEKAERDKENYSCTVRESNQELNADGSIKKNHSKLEERFFVNGLQVDHLLARDGANLNSGDAKKEQERVDKEVKKYSDPQAARKEWSQDETQVKLFLRAVRFTNGYREERANRSVVVYNLSGDPNFHPHKLEERFAQAISGKIWMDEESGTPLELRFQTDKDVKIGGGLVANLHRGFQLHMLQERQPDGVWLTKVIEGSGDAKAALFLHPRFRFQEQVEQCHLFSVNTQQKVQSP